jgi:two-component system response regulator HydG
VTDPTSTAKILIADDEQVVRDTFAEVLRTAGHEVDSAADGEAVLEKIRWRSYDLVLTDLNFPETSGLELLEEIKRASPSTIVVLFSGSPSIEAVLQAFRKGAFDFIVKPFEAAELRRMAERVVDLKVKGEERRRLAEELESERMKVLDLRQQLGMQSPFRRILGSSPAIRQVVETLREVSRTESTILLTGESGTGKGVVARAIHEASLRKDGPFVEANCVVYSEGVLHSELFGHEKGAFTGAARQKSGRFELARGGTLFLDEIGEISPATQLLLLRVLQGRTFERVGGEETIETDVRLIAATNRDLEEAMRRGSFRSDLFYRLNVIPVHLPPLRDRPEDIPVLAQHFLLECTERTGRKVEGFEPDAMHALESYSWPGNVRELENLVERLHALCRGEMIATESLPADLGAGAPAAPDRRSGTLRDLERQRILQALEETRGNKKLAAKRLGIHRSTLYAKMRRYGIDGESTNADGQEDLAVSG